jgi:hypothetical protein
MSASHSTAGDCRPSVNETSGFTTVNAAGLVVITEHVRLSLTVSMPVFDSGGRCADVDAPWQCQPNSAAMPASTCAAFNHGRDHAKSNTNEQSTREAPPATHKPKILTPEEIKMNPAENRPSETKPEPEPTADSASLIAKPSGFSLDKFKSKRRPSTAGVKTLLGALPHHPLVDANDFVRMHPDEKAYWSPELCFVDVPILGMKKDTVHLIDEDLVKLLPAGKKVTRYALALAAKPYNVFFLAHVPTTNLDNSWNESNLQGCRLAKRAMGATGKPESARAGAVRDWLRAGPGRVS